MISIDFVNRLKQERVEFLMLIFKDLLVTYIFINKVENINANSLRITVL